MPKSRRGSRSRRSRKGSRLSRKSKKGSRKPRKSSYWSPGNLFAWLTTPAHSSSRRGSRGSRSGSRKGSRKGSRRSRKGSRRKRLEAYSQASRRRTVGTGISVSLKQSGAYKHRRHSSRSKYSKKYHCKPSSKYGSKKGKKGAVCVCAAQCTKVHEHDEKCQTSVVCVCAAGMKKKKHGSKKTAVSYRRPKIVREGYVRKDGVVVPPTLIEDKGKPGKGPKLIPKLRSGTLSRHGYSSKDPTQQRHEALSKAVKAEGATVVIRKLNVVATLQKNTNPKLSKEMKADSAWVKATFGTTAHPI